VNNTLVTISLRQNIITVIVIILLILSLFIFSKFAICV